jgi:intron-binding protein aquarius
LQYLTVGDFLWRSFILHRCESFFEIRKDIEDTIKRLRPQTTRTGETKFDGFSKMALPISKPAILEVVPPLVSETKPAAVKAEIALDVSRLAESIRREWDSLRPDDVVFLLAVHPSGQSNMAINSESSISDNQRLGIKHIRTAEVIQVLDDNGRSMRDFNGQTNGRGQPRLRRLHVKLDAAMYKEDLEG